jgi:type I restriction enzyme, S subunit
MSFPRYESYKDSGVEWLGEVPAHWDVAPLKRGFNVRLGKMLQTDSSSPADELLPYLRAANIQWTGVDASDIKRMWFSPNERRQLALLPGDLLISEGGDVGRSALWGGEIAYCYFQNSVNRVRAKEGNSNRYLYYWILAIKEKGYIDVLCNKSTIAHFTADKVQAVPVPFPSVPEQQTIAAFLDRETAKIDALIAEQQRLIELLTEKRQAVISHAVTKGLSRLAPSPQPLSHEGRGANIEAPINPGHASVTAASELPSPCGGGVGGEGVPMKNSGIEWLDEVPEHWAVIPVKRVANVFVPQRNKPELNVEGDGIYWATMDDMKTEKILQTSLWVSEDAAKKAGSRVLNRGAVIASCVGNFGVASINSVDLIINQQLQAYLLKPAIKAEFFRYFLGVAKVYFEQVGTAATLTYVNQQGFENLPLALPPLVEQESIVSYLTGEASKFETLTTEAQRAIDLLKERRTALISAAVTGKIDVRGLVFSDGK